MSGTRFDRHSGADRNGRGTECRLKLHRAAEKEGFDFAVPVFLFAFAGGFGAKIRPLQLQRLAASVPDGARRCPPRGRFGFKSLQNKTKKPSLMVLFIWKGRIK